MSQLATYLRRAIIATLTTPQTFASVLIVALAIAGYLCTNVTWHWDAH